MSITNIGRTGLLAAQAGISMSARNTANLMTPGYSRQGLLLTPKSTGGVGVGSLIRFADNYRTQQLWTANTQRGQYSVGESYYKQLEGVMGLEDGSVKAGIDAFFGALDEVSTDPTSSALRLQVLSKADGLAKSFNSLRQAMSRQLDTVRQQSMATADQVNALSGTIADLNQKIAAAEASGAGAPSELLDQRDLAIDTLSGLVDIRVLRQPDGTIDVSLAAGPPLVAAGQVGKISVQTNTDGSFSYSMAFNGTDYPLDGARVGGELGGLSNYATQTLQPQMESMKTLAIELATRINDQLAAGFGTNGNPGIP
ncbi:MAG: flagellar hook-associated protein FlgK, partial [Rhodanobacter sp.]